MAEASASTAPAAPVAHDPAVPSSSRDAPDETAPELASISNAAPEPPIVHANTPVHVPAVAAVAFQVMPQHMPQFKHSGAMEAQKLTEQPFSEAWALAKNWINFALLNIDTVVVILCIYLNSDRSVGYSFGIMIVSWVCLSICILSIIWTAAELLVLLYRGQRKPIHPGAHVGMHLFIWLAAIFATGILTTYWVIGFFKDAYASYLSDNASDTLLSAASLERLGTEDLVLMLMRRRSTLIGRTLTVFMWVIMILHFILFVRACVETHQLRRTGKVVYIIQQPMHQQPMPVMTGVQTPPVPMMTSPYIQHMVSADEKQAMASPEIHGYYAPPAAQPSRPVEHRV